MKKPIKYYLQIIQQGEELTTDQAEAAMDMLISGKVDPVQAGAFLMGLSTRGETTDEILGMLQSMRTHMNRIHLPIKPETPLLDTCGTGGDNQGTFNISTAVALVCGALGVPVAKHGNRAASSKCGSADVLEALHIPITLTDKAAETYFKKNNFVFLFAPNFHPTMKHLAPVRSALGVRTIVNYLGPLANPAGASHQLVGVSDPHKAEMLGQALIESGSEHVVMVYSDDGLDEASVAAASTVLDMTTDGTKRFRIEPRQVFSLDEIRGGTPKTNADIIMKLATGEASAPIIEAVTMNAGLALLAADYVETYEAGRQQAEEFLRSQKLSQYLNQLRP